MNAVRLAALALAVSASVTALGAVFGTAPALAQDWQLRAVCDLRKGSGTGRGPDCIQLMSDVLMLLPEKAGPGNVAVLAELSDNLEKAGVNWDGPCKDAAHCPDHAYTLRYASVSRKMLAIPKDKTFSAFVCREGFSDTAPDETACRLKLLRVVREMVVRARKEGALLALLKCGTLEGDAIRPDGNGVAGFEVIYSFVQLPDMLPMAQSGDTKAAAAWAVGKLAGPEGSGPEQAEQGQTGPNGKAPAAQQPHPSQNQQPQARAQATPAQGPAALPSPPTAPPPPKDEVIMQVSALPSLIQAEALADRLSLQGIESSFERAEVNGKEVYRVYAKGRGTPEAFRQKLAEMGYPGAILKR
uniref:SPOR domain-containing protein n=1 Tax=Fundidesulfovibrio putealis TaxID=270496 RepID=A0A7C4AC87_9BACT